MEGPQPSTPYAEYTGPLSKQGKCQQCRHETKVTPFVWMSQISNWWLCEACEHIEHEDLMREKD